MRARRRSAAGVLMAESECPIEYRTRLLENGRLTIPKPVRDALNWPPGTPLEPERVDDDIVVRPALQLFSNYVRNAADLPAKPKA